MYQDANCYWSPLFLLTGFYISSSDLKAFSDALLTKLTPFMKNPQLTAPFFLDTTLICQLVGRSLVLMREEAIKVLLLVFEILLNPNIPVLLQGSPGVGKSLLTGKADASFCHTVCHRSFVRTAATNSLAEMRTIVKLVCQ